MYVIDYVLVPATQHAGTEIKRFCWAARTHDAAGDREIKFHGTSTIHSDAGEFFADAYATPSTDDYFRSPEWHATAASLEHQVALHVTENIRDWLDGKTLDLHDRIHTVDDADFEEYAM
ncbi:hypothetical protein CUJ91_18455 [Paraburkholderia graminis]|uniref:hypothetical protein n=1 Tax=Paraburkholderia graminis TaxID=60548 RepID=UPI000DEED42F|nr:hypothetical protein [Paraburkholderia graminis]AXF10003.1 hypothetical protein CUJ91_18455 [Paraburkholderia graminis]MDR6472228.1 hypothetical protein [Paraburkholderia graminis]